MNLIVGTAGHIDHGKTTLVRALTGINCDRLDEEQRRGITIELGFAWLDFPNGDRVGIVDVPGHERFIKNMVAGASGIDCVLLVVAADEGVMPQTREHIEICSLLGVRNGIIALTKADLVDPEWLHEITEEIQQDLADTFLKEAPIVAVSSVNGEGLETLRREIENRLSSVKLEKRSDIFRLPIDRVFSMKGFGTVVTGTIIAGACSQGETLRVYPGESVSRVRSLQVHNVQVVSAHEGQRCAINLHDLEVEAIERGDVAALSDTLFPAKSWIIRLYCLKSSALPVRQRSEVHFHHGTRECIAKIVFFDREQLDPGHSAIAEVRFETPLASVYGDHFVIRGRSPLQTIGGGTVIDPLPPVLRKRQADFKYKMSLIEEIGSPDKYNSAILEVKSPDIMVKVALGLSKIPGISFNQLRVCTGLDKDLLRSTLSELAEKGKAFCWDSEKGMWIGEHEIGNCLDACRKRATELHIREPLKSSFSPSALTSGWGEGLPAKFTQTIIQQAVKLGILAQESTGFKLATHKIKFDQTSQKILHSLQNRINRGGLTPPFLKDLIEEFGWEQKKIQPVLNYLCESGEFVKIQDGIYYNNTELAKVEKTIREWFETHEELDIGDIKSLLGISRKFVIPILEYLDTVKITYRTGNKRRLRKA